MRNRESFARFAKHFAVVVTATMAFSVGAEQAIEGTARYSSDVTPLLGDRGPELT